MSPRAISAWSVETLLAALEAIERRVRSASRWTAGPAEDPHLLSLLIPPSNPLSNRSRSELPAQFLEHAEERNALHADAGTHIRDPGLLRAPAGALCCDDG